MTAQRINPHGLGAGLRKLRSWARDHATTIGNVLLLSVMLLAVVWQGVAR